MATIRWCPIFPKWDIYQPLTLWIPRSFHPDLSIQATPSSTPPRQPLQRGFQQIGTQGDVWATQPVAKLAFLPLPTTGCVWKCCVPRKNPMVLLIIIPMKNGYFIGKILGIYPTFSDKPMYQQLESPESDQKIYIQLAIWNWQISHCPLVFRKSQPLFRSSHRVPMIGFRLTISWHVEKNVENYTT